MSLTPPPYRPASDPSTPPAAPRPSGLRWLLVLLGVVALLVVVALALAVDALFLSRGDAGTEELPPSERGAAPTTTLPRVVEVPNLETEGARDDTGFTELDCSFEGRSTLEPPLPMGSPWSTSTHRMELEPGARFECHDASGRSAGTISLEADFPELSLLSGVASGTGRIDWTEVAPSERAVGEPVTASVTAVEVQLDYPVIVVWTTIVDGPHTGLRGRLLLREWERLTDEEGRITGIEFARTRTTFAPA